MRRVLRSLAILIIVAAAATAVIWGYLEGQGERATEAEQDTPIKAPLRVSNVDGAPTITLDAAALRSSGIGTMELQTAARTPELQAYGTVLDLQALTDLSNNYTTTK